MSKSNKDAFRWSKAHQTAFEEYKNLLGSYVKLAHRDPEKKLVLVTDASQQGIAGGLYQMDTNGRLEPSVSSQEHFIQQKNGFLLAIRN